MERIKFMHEIVKTLPVKEYNRLQLIKYSKDCSKYEFGKGGFPQVAFYMFYTQKGIQRESGYVTTYKIGGVERGAVWAKTKKESITKALN